MNTVVTVLIIIAITLVVLAISYFVYSYIKSNKKVDVALIKLPITMSQVTTLPMFESSGSDGSQPYVNAKKNASLSSIGTEYTYNMWIKINAPYMSDQATPLLYRSSGAPTSAAGKLAPANPSVWLYPKDNKLMVRVSTLKGSNSSTMQKEIYPDYPLTLDNYTVVNPLNEANKVNETAGKPTVACDVSNLPMQRWVQLTMVLWNQTLDVYLNGKLVRSCVLPGVPYHEAAGLDKLFIGGPPGGSSNMNGYVSRLRYFNRAITAKEVMDLYKKGPVAVQWWWQVMKNRIGLSVNVGQDD